jgi:type IV fimbrial biogenesis protein FimT
MHQEGFSLVELLLVVLITAIGLGLAVPAFNGLIANQRMAGAVNDLVTALHAARSEALTRQRTVVLCAAAGAALDPDAGACSQGASFADGWIVFTDGDPGGAAADGAPNGDDRILQVHGPLDGFGGLVTAAPGGDLAYVAFSSVGNVIDVTGPGTRVTDVQFCDARGDADTGSGVAAGRWIQVEAPGRPVIHRGRADVEGASPLGGCGA